PGRVSTQPLRQASRPSGRARYSSDNPGSHRNGAPPVGEGRCECGDRRSATVPSRQKARSRRSRIYCLFWSSSFVKLSAGLACSLDSEERVPVRLAVCADDRKTEQKPGSRVYFPELDGMRFIAFLLVYLFHGGVPPRVLSQLVGSAVANALRSNGGYGVQLFFFLSGYLIVTPLFTG